MAWTERGLDHRAAGCLLLGLVALIYLAAYLRHPLYPGSAPVEMRVGWWSWADQFAYWRSAAGLAQFQLTAEQYHYPMGYPILGALFWRIMPTHAFLVPNLLMVLGAAVVWWLWSLRWLSRWQALVVGVVFVVIHQEMLTLALVIPWNTIATQLTLLAGMWVMMATRGPGTVWWLTFLAVMTLLVRPGDAACFAPMLVWAVVRLPGWWQKLICAAGGMLAIGAVFLAVGLINRSVFGTWSTPYEISTWQGIGFFSYPVLDKLFWIFVDGRPFFGEADTALFFRHPWLLLIVPGVIYAVRTEGMTAVAALATLAMNWGLYLNYNDFFPSGIYRYSLIHYLVWGFAPLFALTAAALLRGWRLQSVRWGLVFSAGLTVIVLGLQMEPHNLPVEVSAGRADRLPATRPLWISFPGVPMEAAIQLRLDGQGMQENRDYQIPYVPVDLRLLLSTKAQGATAAFPAEAGISVHPVVGDYVWRWRFDAERTFGPGHPKP